MFGKFVIFSSNLGWLRHKENSTIYCLWCNRIFSSRGHHSDGTPRYGNNT